MLYFKNVFVGGYSKNKCCHIPLKSIIKGGGSGCRPARHPLATT